MAVLVHQIRPSVAGSSAEVFWTGAIPIEPLSLRNAEAGAVGETCASVSAPELRPVGHCLGSEPMTGADDRFGGDHLDPSAFGVPRSRIHPSPATGREEGRHPHSDHRP